MSEKLFLFLFLLSSPLSGLLWLSFDSCLYLLSCSSAYSHCSFWHVIFLPAGPFCSLFCQRILLFFSLLTFPRCIAHYGMIGNFSLPAVSATGGQQALRHLWTRCTLVCGANTKNSTAGLLIVKWIQLLLVFSWGFQPPQRVINLDPAF